jgi:hypothetical protein
LFTSCGWEFSTGGGAIWRKSPLSVSIDDVTRKKISNINEMSAVDVVFSSGIC